MARTPTRRQIVQRAMQARSPSRSGGTTAPRSAADGPRTGLGRNRPTPRGYGAGPARPAPAGRPSGAASTGAGTPAAPPPWDSEYETSIAGARRRHDRQIGDLDLAETTTRQEYGLDAGFNDYKANPFSRAALLQETYNKSNRGTMNAAGLQLYSGSTGNRLAGNRRVHAERRDELERLYRDSIGEIGQRRAEAAEERGEDESGAAWDRNTRAEGADLEPEAAPAPGRLARRRRKKRGGGGGAPQLAPARPAAASRRRKR